MGCIMTPIPNHLSTLKPRKEVWRTHQQGCGEEKSSVGKDRRKKKKNTPKKYIRTDQGRRTC